MQHLSTREIAEMLGTDVWRIQRLFEDGNLDEPPRFAGKRMINSRALPIIIDALRRRGWLATEATIEQRPKAIGGTHASQ